MFAGTCWGEGQSPGRAGAHPTPPHRTAAVRGSPGAGRAAGGWEAGCVAPPWPPEKVRRSSWAPPESSPSGVQTAEEGERCFLEPLGKGIGCGFFLFLLLFGWVFLRAGRHLGNLRSVGSASKPLKSKQLSSLSLLLFLVGVS